MGTTAAAIAFLSATVNQFDGDGNSGHFDTTALQGLTDISAERGKITCRLPVAARLQNRYNTLHGGCIATLVDTVGTAALLTVSARSGVSLNINVNYLRGMPGGGDVVIEAKVVKVGKNIATIDVVLKDQGSGKLVAQGTHVKYMADNQPEITSLMSKPLQRSKL